jgi:hypothetical protein
MSFSNGERKSGKGERRNRRRLNDFDGAARPVFAAFRLSRFGLFSLLI